LTQHFNFYDSNFTLGGSLYIYRFKFNRMDMTDSRFVDASFTIADSNFGKTSTNIDMRRVAFIRSTQCITRTTFGAVDLNIFYSGVNILGGSWTFDACQFSALSPLVWFKVGPVRQGPVIFVNTSFDNPLAVIDFNDTRSIPVDLLPSLIQRC